MNYQSDIDFTDQILWMLIKMYSRMTIDKEIIDEKLQYNINEEGAKISARWSGEIHWCEYFTGENILSSNQKQIIEQKAFEYSKNKKSLNIHCLESFLKNK